MDIENVYKSTMLVHGNIKNEITQRVELCKPEKREYG